MSTNYDELTCWCALNNIFGYKPQVAKVLVDSLGSAQAIFNMDKVTMFTLLGPYNKYSDKICTQSLDEAAEELEKIQKQGYRFISRADPDFPALMNDCDDCPSGLYIRSNNSIKDIFGAPPYISIVGTRDMTPYGREWCQRIVKALSTCTERPTIVSGLAMGVDITAHKTAIEYGLPTIAVLPTGIGDVYPTSHAKFADTICKTPGSALITDYPSGTAPLAITFVRRNRIIAGMSSATILIESKSRGGGMITAKLASSYGRDVYALPGRADDIRSQGCNLIIKNKTAEAIYNETGLLASLNLKGTYRPSRNNFKQIASSYRGKISGDLIEITADVLLTIKQNRGIKTEEIARLLMRDYKDIGTIVGMLEADGFIETDLFQRCSISQKK